MQIARSRLVLVFVVALAVTHLSTWPAAAQRTAAPNSPSIVEVGVQQFVAEGYDQPAEKAAALVAKIQKRDRIPGMAAACAIDGKLVWAEGFGLANVELDVPATPRTRFRVGSISKVLTVGAVAKLVEAGKLDLDAPVQTYVPSFPKKEYPVTTRQLTGHLAGIRHYLPTDTGDSQHFDDVVDALTIFQDDPLIHPPGSKWSYSSYAWNLVAAVVQGASGRPFLEFMQQEVFNPLGLDDTCADQRRKIIPNRTAFYGRDGDDNLSNLPEIDISYKWAGGGFLSSVEDLVLYGSAYLPGTDFLKPETLELVFTKQQTNDGIATRNGIGWAVSKDADGHALYSHGGSLQGCRAYLLIMPHSRVVVAIAANNRHGVNINLADALKLARMFAL